jgi:DNA-binding CsgD family transcriptional regulator
MPHGDSQNTATLSARELQVIELVAAGLTNQEIADQLEISKRTVDNHISNILNKTKTSNRVALVRWGLQSGKVCIDDVNCCTLPSAGDSKASEKLDEMVDSSEIEPKAMATDSTQSEP